MFKMSNLAYVSALARVTASASDKMFVGSVAVAASIVEQLDLPTAPVESPTAYYSKQLAMTVRDQISAFNEACPIDTNRCVDISKKLWLFRYNVLWGSTPYVGIEGNFFCGYMQCGVQFSPNEMEMMNKYAVPIATLQNHIRLMIDQEVKRAVTLPSMIRTDASAITERMPASY